MLYVILNKEIKLILFFYLQTQLCTRKDLDCLSSINVESLDCLPQCSGILVTSYTNQNIEDRFKKLVEYLRGKSNDYIDTEDISEKFQGSN